MDEEKFLDEISKIKEIRFQTSLKVLIGVEIDINEDGTLDYCDNEDNVMPGIVHSITNKALRKQWIF